jgi:hypothetical protein
MVTEVGDMVTEGAGLTVTVAMLDFAVPSIWLVAVT